MRQGESLANLSATSYLLACQGCGATSTGCRQAPTTLTQRIVMTLNCHMFWTKMILVRWRSQWSTPWCRWNSPLLQFEQEGEVTCISSGRSCRPHSQSKHWRCSWQTGSWPDGCVRCLLTSGGPRQPWPGSWSPSPGFPAKCSAVGWLGGFLTSKIDAAGWSCPSPQRPGGCSRSWKKK